MGRLIAFDQQTASTLVARTRTAAQLGHGSPLRAAISNEGEATLLMPAVKQDEVLVVTVRRPVKKVQPSPVFAPHEARVAPDPQARAAKPAPPEIPTPPRVAQTQPLAKTPPPAPSQPAAKHDDEPVAYEATGFLGLGDSPVYAEDIAEQEKQAKKKWWQKLLD